MPELKYGAVVNYQSITYMEGYYENSEDKQNREADKSQDIKSDTKESD